SEGATPVRRFDPLTRLADTGPLGTLSHRGRGSGGHQKPDAVIYDHVRTPRGLGKKDGALHEVTALNLATQALRAIRDRNNLDTKSVDDVVLGCVDPVGEAGGDIARIAALNADF